MTTAMHATGLRHRRILVVDDELAPRKGLAQRFEEEGAEVATADSVTLARKALKEADFDLVVLDHRLPDGTGLALLEEQKRNGAAATFIRMTAYSSTEDAIRAMKAGAADDLLRPFDLDELVLVAERALASELFGHEKGAFTDAKTAKRELFEEVEGARSSATRSATCRRRCTPSCCASSRAGAFVASAA
jgi:DNA-binding NtrC family response regulator